jgi:hypothetical protein
MEKLHDKLQIKFEYQARKTNYPHAITNLQYTIINLGNNEHVKYRVFQMTVTNCQRFFKFRNISSQNGVSQ